MLLFMRLVRAVTEWQWAYPGLVVPPCELQPLIFWSLNSPIHRGEAVAVLHLFQI